MITEKNNKFLCKTQRQKDKLDSKKEKIATLRVECETKNAEITDLKAQLAEIKALNAIYNKDISIKNSENHDL